jgi:hypothetical protein
MQTSTRRNDETVGDDRQTKMPFMMYWPIKEDLCSDGITFHRGNHRMEVSVCCVEVGEEFAIVSRKVSDSGFSI